MSDNYQKVGKIFTLDQSNGTSATSIPSAAFIHGIVNTHTSTIRVTIDESYIFNLNGYNTNSLSSPFYINFPVPVTFSTIKIDTGTGHAAQIIYS